MMTLMLGNNMFAGQIYAEEMRDEILNETQDKIEDGTLEIEDEEKSEILTDEMEEESENLLDSIDENESEILLDPIQEEESEILIEADNDTEVDTYQNNEMISVMSSRASSIAQLRQKYPAGKYWNHAGNPGTSNSVNNQDGYTSTPCPKHGNVNTSSRTCNGFELNGTQFSWQCMGYAEKLGYETTGSNPRENKNGWYTYTNSSALDTLKAGDIVRYKNNGHSIFVIGVNGDTVTYTDCNSDGHCIIRWDATISKSTLRSTFTYVRSAPNSLTNEDVCNCSDSYAGTYICTSATTLKIRSGHGTGYSQIGSIPNGAEVYVSKADGNWAHVSYNGCNGYASMAYLQRKGNAPAGYNISVNKTELYNSDTLEITVTPANGSEVTEYKYYVEYNGTVRESDWTTENRTGVRMKNFLGEVSVYAEVRNAYGSCKGSRGNGSMEVHVKKAELGTVQNLGNDFYATIVNTGSGTAVDRNTTTNGIAGWSQNGNDNQVWRFLRQPDGSYKIASKSDENMVLDVCDGKSYSGTRVQTYSSNDSDAQRWYIYAAGGGNYYLRPKCSESAILDLSNAGKENDTAISIWTYNGGSAQKWSITRVAGEISSSQSSVTLNVPSDSVKTITLTAGGSLPSSYHFSFKQSADFFDCAWTGEWNGKSHDLKIQAKKAGTGTLTVYLVDGNTNEKLASTEIQVTASAKSYTVSYDLNGGSWSGNSQSKSHGEDLQLSSVIPQKEYTLSYNVNGNCIKRTKLGCTFKGWNTRKDGSGVNYASGSSYTADASVTLYAVWKNPSAGKLEDMNVVMDGYEFAGWYTSVSGGNRASDNMEISKNTDLYARWSSHTHNYGKEITKKEATCTEPGIKVKVCSECGEESSEETIIPVTGHKFGNYIVTKEPTVLSEGVKTCTCSVCGQTEDISIPKLSGNIRLTAMTLALKVKESIQLSGFVTDMAKGDYIISYVSDNTAVATVDSAGTVTGQNAGTANITITLTSGASAAIRIRVESTSVIEHPNVSGQIKMPTTQLKVSSTIKVGAGQKKKLVVTVIPENSTDKVTYTSANKKIATVSSDGTITGKKVGKTKITVKSGNKKTTVTVMVTKKVPTGIKGIPVKKTLKKGKTFRLKAKIIPSGAVAKITYQSSNKKVATVDSKGKVKAKKAGKAVITGKAGTVKVTCMITVK